MTKDVSKKNRKSGLKNPLVRGTTTDDQINKVNASSDSFRTHIPEPRWQQIISVVAIVGFISIWIYIIARSK